MSKKIYKIISVIFYLISFFIVLYCISVKYNSKFNLSSEIKILLLLIVCLLIYINGYILVKKLNYSKKILKLNLIFYFVMYNALIFSFTLFDEIYGRKGIIFVNWNQEILRTYLKYSFNIVPFRTIKLFINGYINGYVSFRVLSVNIIGNFVAFMPYGMFLPLIFKRMNKYKNFLLTMIIIVILIELLQFATISGSCDIDDLILNVLGASIIFLIMKIKIINKLMHKIFLY